MKDTINTWSRNSAFAFILTHTHTHTQNKKGKRGKERKGKERREKGSLSCAARRWFGVLEKETKKNKNKKMILFCGRKQQRKDPEGKRGALSLSISLSQITTRFHKGRRGRKGIISRYKRKKGKEKEEENFHTYKQTSPKSRAPLSLTLCHCCC